VPADGPDHPCGFVAGPGGWFCRLATLAWRRLKRCHRFPDSNVCCRRKAAVDTSAGRVDAMGRVLPIAAWRDSGSVYRLHEAAPGHLRPFNRAPRRTLKRQVHSDSGPWPFRISCGRRSCPPTPATSPLAHLRVFSFYRQSGTQHPDLPAPKSPLASTWRRMAYPVS